MDSPDDLMRRDTDLFHLSGMVDVLRDTAKDLLGLGLENTGTPADLGLVDRYRVLRAEITDILPADRAETVQKWSDTLSEGEATMAEVFVAASHLARIIDLFLNTEMFLISRIQQRSMLAGATPAPEGAQRAPATGAGQYL